MKFAFAELTTKACVAILHLRTTHLADVMRYWAVPESVQLITTRDVDGEEGTCPRQGFLCAFLHFPVYSRDTYRVAD